MSGPAKGASPGCGCQRRDLLGAAVGLAAGLSALPAVAEGEAQDAASMPPQVGDQLVFLAGDKKGQAIRAEDLAVGGPQVQAWPFDPKTKTVRDQNRLNMLVALRFDPKDLSEETRANSDQGVVVYSDICTHQGCPVNMWEKDLQFLFCSCHGSQYDPKNAAEVQAGPAPRGLPALPIKVEDGTLVVAGKFSGRVGSEIH
jgi:rieske iron-sulfur protein